MDRPGHRTGFTPTAGTLGFLAYAAMTTDPGEAFALLTRAADMARDTGDRFTEAALRMPIVNSQRTFSPPADGGEQVRLTLAAARACGSPTAIAMALESVATMLALLDRQLALDAIDELPSVAARSAFLDGYVRHPADLARAWLQVAEGNPSGLAGKRQTPPRPYPGARRCAPAP